MFFSKKLLSTYTQIH